MANFMRDSFDSLKYALLENAGDVITITRGNAVVFNGPAVVAKSRFYDVDYTTRRVVTYSSDFIVDASSGYEPQSGDIVNHDGIIYVVRPVANELWAYGDPYQTTLRIHTQLKG